MITVVNINGEDLTVGSRSFLTFRLLIIVMFTNGVQEAIAAAGPAVGGMQPIVLSGHRGAVYSAVFSPGGKEVATASKDGTARVWDERTGACIHIFAGHGSTVMKAIFSPDGTKIMTTSFDGIVRVWDIRAAACLHLLAANEHNANFASFSPAGEQIVTAGSMRKPVYGM